MHMGLMRPVSKLWKSPTVQNIKKVKFLFLFLLLFPT
jgi:hypothetical protein